MTWWLWHHIRYPAVHPLFRRTIRIPTTDLATPYVAWLMFLLGALTCCGMWALVVHMRSAVAVLLLLLLVFFSGSIYVVAWVIGISISIAREHEHGTYDQLCLPPTGALGANWAICTATLHRNDTFGWVNLIRLIITGSLLVIFLMVLLTTLLTQSGPNFTQFVLLFLDISGFAIASYLDHVQSVVVGCLVGMLTPTFAPHRPDARVVGVTLFLTLQVFAYGFSALVGFGLLTAIYESLHIQGWLPDAAMIVLRVVIFYLVREAIIAILWRVLVERINADSSDWDRVLRFQTGVR